MYCMCKSRNVLQAVYCINLSLWATAMLYKTLNYKMINGAPQSIYERRSIDVFHIILIIVSFPKNYTYDTNIIDTMTIITCISNTYMNV